MVEVEGDGGYAKTVESERDRQIRPGAKAQVLSVERSDFYTDERLDEPGHMP